MAERTAVDMFLHYVQENPKCDRLKVAIEKFGAEVVDMLEPDEKGNNYHNCCFPDRSHLDNVSKTSIKVVP